MKKTINYKTHGTCSREINIVLDDGIVESVEFVGGCDGNTHGIENLVKGMKAEEVVERLSGITCGYKSTSCPDQLSLALKEAMQNN